MTVVSALITKHGSAQASDSFLTTRQTDGSWKVVEDKKPKLIYAKRWRGALSFWGLAGYGKWSTLEWLREQVQLGNRLASPEEFADFVATNLNKEISKLPLNGTQCGIGIHFTAYEKVEGYNVPELFQITNWADASYAQLRPSGVVSLRETYHALQNVAPAPEHRDAQFRRKVREALESGTVFRFNNGDPALYNPIANAIMDCYINLLNRRVTAFPTDAKIHCALVRRPIEVVSRLLTDVTRKGTRLIGGKLHDLCVFPTGRCWSSTGDRG